VKNLPFQQVYKGRWPTGDAKPIAVLRAEPDELAERLGVEFTDGADDLDAFREAALHLASGRLLLLVRYQNDPFPGTQVQADSADNPDDARQELLQAFGFSEGAFLWVRDVP
jgi:hypothetical protein